MRRLYLPAFVIFVAIAALAWLQADRSPAAERAEHATSPASGTFAAHALTRSQRVHGERVVRQQYSLAYSHQVFIDGQDVAPTWVNATWTTEPVLSSGVGAKDDNRVQVTLSDVALDGMEVMPEAAAMQTSFQIVHQSGRLTGLGFPVATPIEARGLLTTLACALWYTPDPGADQDTGDDTGEDPDQDGTWTVEEDDRTGRYIAHYQWQSHDAVTRTRLGFLAMRTPRGLDARSARALSTDGETRFSFDDQGLHEVVVNEHLTMRMGEGMPTMSVVVEARLRRTHSQEIAARVIAALPVEPIRAHGQAGEPTEREVAMQTLGDATIADLLNEVRAVGSLLPGSGEEQEWRARTLSRLTAMLQVDPASAQEVAGALAAAGDPRMAAVVAGALGDAGTTEATAALTELLAGGALASTSKRNVAVALALTESPSADSAGALTSMLDDPEVGPSAALALGAQAGKLSEIEPEAASSAMDTLLERYARATDMNERTTLLSALANSGDPRALPVMREAIMGQDSRLAELATYGLRFIPGAEADALLIQQLTGATSREIKVQAIRAVGHRSAAAWRDQLSELQAQYASEAAIRDAIDDVLAQWGA